MGINADPEALERVGTVLNDKWTLERLIGIGGMGAVYAARHRNGARAAVKILHPELASVREIRERFLREGYAANKVEHPGAVKVLDDDVVARGPDEGTTYLVMELLEGDSLQDRIERGPPIDEEEFLRIADDVLDVLQAAHQQGVVHRDLKPENLFFGNDENGKRRVKVLDFGLARLLQERSITGHGHILGTPSFMSPEQAAGRLAEIDGRTDLFALAATGFRLRAGRRIHEADNTIDLVRLMATVPAPRLRDVALDVSRPYARVIDKALEFKRGDRYETAAAMQSDVRRALEELKRPSESPAAPEPPKPSVTSESTMDVSEGDFVGPPAFGMDESIRIPKRRAIWPWVALLALSAAGVKAWLYFHPTVTSSDATGAEPSAAPDAGAHVPDAGAVRPRPSSPRHPPSLRPAPSPH